MNSNNDYEVIIDCSNLDKSISTLSRIYGIDKTTLIKELYIIDAGMLLEYSMDENYIHSYFCKKFGIISQKIDKVLWFHFTRTLNFSDYKKIGILPMNKSLPILMKKCYVLLQSKSNKKRKNKRIVWHRKILKMQQWKVMWDEAIKNLELRDSIKFKNREYGPYGMLVKDVGLYPNKGGACEFLEIPEILDGILREIATLFGINILKKYIKVAKSCVITFESKWDRQIEHITTPILEYAYGKIHNSKSICGHMNFDGKNHAVNKKFIRKIERITKVKHGGIELVVIYDNK